MFCRKEKFMLIRLFDVFISATSLVFGSPVFLIIALILLIDTGSPIFRQERLGLNQRRFTLLKFRTMKMNTPDVATHLVNPTAVTRFGGILRRSKMDELPQLWNVLKGDMSLVGPRPGLPQQVDLITERARLGVFDVRPGLTGLAQVKNVDMRDPAKLARYDSQLINTLTVKTYFAYILQTAFGAGGGDRVDK